MNSVKFETSALNDAHDAKKVKSEEDQNNTHLKQNLAMRGLLYTPNVMKADLIETIKTIYSNMTVSEYKIVNVSSDANNSQGAALG